MNALLRWPCAILPLVTGLLASCSDGDPGNKDAPGGATTGGDGGLGGTGGSMGDAAGPDAAQPVQHADKIDLLFMIDNSASMADKQQLLASAIPHLLDRLTNPACVDADGNVVAQVLTGDACPDGSERQFPPVTDIHLGVISSSLGGHGADSCSDSPTMNWNPRQEDMSHLLNRGDPQVPTYEGRGFLNWDPNAQDTPPGESNLASLSQDFESMVVGVDQDGCGFESSLEAWYRFLIDPAPYQSMVPGPCNESDTSNSCRNPNGVDNVVLQQRADFLRQDSVVVVVMLTDENDCSGIDDAQNFLAFQHWDGTGQFHLAPGTAACETDPNSPDCQSCWQADPSVHPECQQGWQNPERDDPLNLRCYRQKQRFGIDFLYPVERYIEGLTSPTLEEGTVNPLFCNAPSADGQSCTVPMRDVTQVVLTGIVGVPWQDIANDPLDATAGLKPASQIDWDMILGDPAGNIEPSDPLMVESIDPRQGQNPATGQALASPGSGVSNGINGSEWTVSARNDLQYACVFALPEPRDCTLPENTFGCDCHGASENPLCWNGASYGTMQHYAKSLSGEASLVRTQGDWSPRRGCLHLRSEHR